MSNTPRPPPLRPLRVKAKYAYVPRPNVDSEMQLDEGDEIEVFEISEVGWAFGKCDTGGRSGWFPITYTEVVEDAPEE